jgi:hypothetical protein
VIRPMRQPCPEIALAFVRNRADPRRGGLRTFAPRLTFEMPGCFELMAAAFADLLLASGG